MSDSILGFLTVEENGIIYGAIRNYEGKYSVYDFIKVVANKKNPRQFWNDLCMGYPEVVQIVDNFQFPGKGQKETPVTYKEGLLYILGLLPGAAGDNYRRGAARLVLQLLDAPEELAKVAIERVESAEELQEVASIALAKYLSSYHPLFDEIRDRTSGSTHVYINVNKLNTKVILGKEPTEIVKERGGKTARSKCSVDELMKFKFIQDLEHGAIKKVDAQGSKQVYDTAKEAAIDFQNLLNKYNVGY